MATKKKAPAQTPTQLAQEFRRIAQRHSIWQVFADFNEMAAISLAAADIAQAEEREQRYLRIVKGYEPEELAVFPEILGALVLQLEQAPSDVLGSVFHELELHNKWAGQFFTPYAVSRLLADMTLHDVAPIIEQQGFITVSEPACGAGGMAVAVAHVLKDRGVDYQQALHITAVDVDLKCVHMAFVQLALLGVPATVIHGNTLSLETWSAWHTPAHVLGGWNRKLRERREKAA